MRQVERWMQVPDLAACSAISGEIEATFPDGFAVVHVQAHAVSQSVRHEEGHGAGSDGIFRRAAHQAQRDEAFGQDAVRGVVDIHVRHVRAIMAATRSCAASTML